MTYPNYVPTIFPSNPSNPYCSNKGFDQFEETPVTWRGSSTAVIFLHDGSPREMVRAGLQVSILGSDQTKNTCFFRGDVYKLRGITMYNYKL